MEFILIRIYSFNFTESVGFMHQIQFVTREIEQNVRSGCKGFLDQDINVSLSIGFGPLLTWKLREFVPEESGAFLKQSQYIHDPRSGKSLLIEKWSPPLGIKEFDKIAIANFERYLDQLMQPNVLKRLGAKFYRAESEMDRKPEKFQATLLQLMCDLYVNSNDVEVSIFCSTLSLV
jgi:hypothetical protein